MKTKTKTLIKNNDATIKKHISLLSKAAEAKNISIDDEDRPYALELADAGMLKLPDFGKHMHPFVVSSITLKGRAFLFELLSIEEESSPLRSAWRALLAIFAFFVAASQVGMAILDFLRFTRGL
jgi:hypothetical protein